MVLPLVFKNKPELKSVSLTLDESIIAELDRLARIYKRSVSEVARQIFHNVLTRKSPKGKEK